jgi:hypothetical protein
MRFETATEALPGGFTGATGFIAIARLRAELYRVSAVVGGDEIEPP